MLMPGGVGVVEGNEVVERYSYSHSCMLCGEWFVVHVSLLD